MEKWEIENSICYFESSNTKRRQVNRDFVKEDGCSLLVVSDAGDNTVWTWMEEGKSGRSPTCRFVSKPGGDNRLIIRINECSNYLKIWIREKNDGVRYFKGDINVCELKGCNIELSRCYIMKGSSFIMYGEKKTFKVLKYSCKGKGRLHFAEPRSKHPQSKLDISYNNKLFKIDGYTCVFCFWGFKNEQDLLKHMKASHLYHNTESKGSLIYITQKTDDEIKGNYLFGIAIYQNDILKMFYKSKKRQEYHKTDFLFIRSPFKRNRPIAIKKIPKIKFAPETMDISGLKSGNDAWLEKVVKHHLRDIIDTNHVDLMVAWNLYIRRINCGVDRFNIQEVVIGFIKNVPADMSVVEFLIVLYRKAILSKSDISKVLTSVTVI